MAKRLCKFKKPDGSRCSKHEWKDTGYCWHHARHSLDSTEGKPWYRTSGFYYFVVGIVASILVAASVFFYQDRARKEAEAKSALSGEFKPAEDPCSPHALRLLFAGNEMTVGTVRGEGRIPIVGLFGAIELAFKEGSVLVSAKVVSPDGRITARIKDNEWQVNPNNHFDRNYDKSALEVLDAQSGVAVLQVEFLDKATLRLAGLFGDRDGYTCVTDSGSHGIPDPNGMAAVASKTRDALRDLEFIFRYPSDRHLGEHNPDRELPGHLGKESRLKQALQERAGSYSKVTAHELVTTALGFAQRVGEFAWTERARLMAIRKGQKPVTEEAAKKREQELGEYSRRLVQEYERSFCIEAILLRDELLRRQPQISRDYMDYRSYEHVNNVLVVESVAADLERLAKSLTRQE
jgi:hypothetical protein